jgi:hypothetical protein
MNTQNTHLKPSINEDEFFDIPNIKNKKIIKLTSIVEELQNKIEDIGLDISFIQKDKYSVKNILKKIKTKE